MTNMNVNLSNQDDLIWSKNCFPNKTDPDEDLVLLVRQDISVLILYCFKFFIVFIVFLVVQIILSGLTQPLISAIFDTVFFSVNCLMILFFAVFFHDYYLSLQIVTSRRIIDIDQKGLFNRQIDQMPIINIQDVAFKQSGIFSVLFDFGNVIVQSSANTLENAGGKKVDEKLDAGFVFNNAPSPSEITAIISDLYHAEKEKIKIDTAKTNAEYIRQALSQNQPNPFTGKL